MTPVQKDRENQQKKRVALIGVGVCALLGFVAFQMSIFGRAPGMLDDELKGAAQDGLPLSAADLTRQIAIPDSQNGAGAMEGAFVKYRAWSKTVTLAAPGISNIVSMSDAKVRQAEGYLNGIQPILDQLTYAVTFPKLVFQRDWALGPAVMFPEFADIRFCRELLYFQFRDRELKGQTQAALDTLDTLAKVSALIGQDPTMVGILSGGSVQSMTCEGVALMLRAHGGDRAVLNRCKTILDDLGPRPDLRRAMRSDFLMGILSAQMLGGPDGEKMFGDTENVAKIGRFGPAKNVLELRYVHQMRAVIHVLNGAGDDDLKVRAALNKLDDEGSGQRDWSYGLVHILGTAYGGLVSVVGSEQARTNVLRSAIALLEKRNASDPFPSALPGRDGIWLDPFTDKQLIYKPSKNGFLIYSVGPNGRDDDGKPRGAKSPIDTDDLPFSYP